MSETTETNSGERYLLHATRKNFEWEGKVYPEREFIVYAERGRDWKQVGASLVADELSPVEVWLPDETKRQKVVRPPVEGEREYTTDFASQLFTDDEARTLEADFAAAGVSTRREAFAVPLRKVACPVGLMAFSPWQCACGTFKDTGLPFDVGYWSWFTREEVFGRRVYLTCPDARGIVLVHDYECMHFEFSPTWDRERVVWFLREAAALLDKDEVWNEVQRDFAAHELAQELAKLERDFGDALADVDMSGLDSPKDDLR